jgi:hypothetical protein
MLGIGYHLGCNHGCPPPLEEGQSCVFCVHNSWGMSSWRPGRVCVCVCPGVCLAWIFVCVWALSSAGSIHPHSPTTSLMDWCWCNPSFRWLTEETDRLHEIAGEGGMVCAWEMLTNKNLRLFYSPYMLSDLRGFIGDESLKLVSFPTHHYHNIKSLNKPLRKCIWLTV